MKKRPNSSAQRGALTIKTAIRAGRIAANHSRPALKVKTAIRAGRIAVNHNGSAL
jgi:hypothetical protein